MVFSSITFVCLFLVCVFVLYYLVPNIKYRNVLLLIFSLVFYSFGEPIYVFLMIGMSLINYIFARLIVSCDKFDKLFVAISCVVNLSVLGGFKYTNFIVDSINGVLNTNIFVAKSPLPIGISFFTFQTMSYVIDVYKDKKIMDRNYGHILLYILLFPQLIAGPIIKYHDVHEQIRYRQSHIDEIVKGIRRFILGLNI